MDNMKLKSKSKIYLISLSILALMLVTVIPQNTFIMPTSATSAAGTQGSNGSNFNINDHSIAESTIDISKSKTISSVSVYISIVHTWINDLVIWVISPSGTSYQIWCREGGSADNINKDFSIKTAFDGQNCYGTWKLKVQDCASYDTGYIDYWSIAITTGTGCTSQYETNCILCGCVGEGSAAVSRDAYYINSTHHKEVNTYGGGKWSSASILNYYAPDDVYVDWIAVEAKIFNGDWSDIYVALYYWDDVNHYWVNVKTLWDYDYYVGEKVLQENISVSNPSYTHKPHKWSLWVYDKFPLPENTGQIKEFSMVFASDKTSDTSDIKTALNSYQLVDNTLKVIEDIKGYCNSYYLSHSSEPTGKMAKALADFTNEILGSTGAHIKDAIYEVIGSLFRVSPTDTMTEEEIRNILKNALKTSYFSPCISMLVTGAISVAISLADPDTPGSITTDEMKTIVANVIDAGIGDALEPVFGIGFAYDAWCVLTSVGILPSTWTLGNLIVDFIW